MLNTLNDVLNNVDNFIWGMPLIILILFTGILLTVRLRGLQIRHLGKALHYVFHNEDDGEGEVTSFGALCTALSATIGTGNIVGCATAIVAGGPGALFWMWLAAFFGMATKYAEGMLAVKYRVIAEDGHTLGGPFYYIEKGMGKNFKWLAKLFCVFGTMVGLFGIGTFTQVNGITSAVNNFFDPSNVHTISLFGMNYSISVVVAGIIVTICAGLVIIGGIKRISKVSEVIVPFMAVTYIGVCLIIVFTHLPQVPEAFAEIVQSAFGLKAVAGGAIGAMTVAMQKGIARGIFSNEAGLGSAPIAAAAAQTNEPVRQGLVSMTGTFIDTIVICTMTGLAIVLTQSYTTGLDGAAMTTYAFSVGLFIPLIGKYIVNIGLVFFAFTTIIGWNYYGERCMYYLKGLKAVKIYKIVYIIFIAIGPFMSLEFIFVLADIVNGCMAIPNLIGLIGLRKEIVAETEKYFEYEQPVELVTNIEG